MSHQSPLGLALGAFLLALPALSQEPEAEKHLLRYRLQKGATGHFVMRQDMAMKMDMGGQQTMDTDVDTQSFFEVVVGDVADGKAALEMKLYRIKTRMDNPMMGTIDYDSDDEDSDPGMLAPMMELVGTVFRIELDDRGTVTDFKVPEDAEDEAVQMFGDPKGIFAQFFARLPEAPVGIGDTWESSFTQPLGQMGKVRVKLKNKLVAVENTQVTLDQEMQLDLDRESPMAMKLEVSKAKGTMVLDLTRGFPVRSDMEMDMRMKTETEGMKMDMQMELDLSMQLVAPPAKKKEKEGDKAK